jgi:hypothetical protein
MEVDAVGYVRLTASVFPRAGEHRQQRLLRVQPVLRLIEDH